MQATRRYWAAMGVALALAALAALVDRAVLLWGTAAVAGPVLARQAVFRRRTRRLADALATSVDVDRDRVRVDAPVAVSLAATLPVPAGHPVTVRVSRPVGATGGAGPTVTLDPGEREATATAEYAFPVAGGYSLPPPTVTVADAGGLFRAETVGTATATIRVDPRRPRAVHVGQGGTEAAATYGDHRTGRSGAGTVPSEVRQYVPGDDVRHIDWAATARLADVYVREHDAETDRTTAIVVDAGPSMATGPPGETQLDFAVHVALTLVAVAADHRDPVGLVTADGDGLHWEPPAAGRSHYEAVRDRLRRLEPTAGAALAGPGRGPRPGQRAALLADGSPFAEPLQPLLGPARTGHGRAEGDPLVPAAAGPSRRRGGTAWTAILTDDRDPARVVEAVRAARRGDDRVTVFLLPDVLFEPGGLADLEAAYDRYRTFESFRARLDRMERVTALEVGPADRVEAVLGARPGVGR